MDIKLLTDFEKQSIGERQPLPERYLRLSDDELDARIAAAKATLGDRVRHPRPPLPARRGDQVRRLHRRFAEAVARRGQPHRGRLHRLLRRALHGRERRHPARAAPEGGPAGSRRRLLDGRHGGGRSARDLLARAGADGDSHRRGRERQGRTHSRHLHQLVGGDQSLRRRARRHRLHVDQCPRHHDVGLGARREAGDAARSASRAEHRLQDGRAARRDGGVGSERDVGRARRRAGEERRSSCCGRATARSTPASPSRRSRPSGRNTRRAASSRIRSARSTSCAPPTRAARPSTSSTPSRRARRDRCGRSRPKCIWSTV